MATVAATNVANLGSLEGGVIGTFQISSGRASGDVITVADAGVGPNTQILALIPQGSPGAITYYLAVTAITPGVGFSVTFTSSGSSTAALTVNYLRSA